MKTLLIKSSPVFARILIILSEWYIIPFFFSPLQLNGLFDLWSVGILQEPDDMLMKDGFFSATPATNVGVSPY